MYKYKSAEAVQIADKLNAQLSAKDSMFGLNNNVWNKLVAVELTSRMKMATQVNNRPYGLMKIVGDAGEKIQAAPLPSKDFIVSKNFTIKAKHEISFQDVRKYLGETAKVLFSTNSSEDAKLVLQSQGMQEVIREQTNLAVNSLGVKLKNTIAKYIGDALNGSLTLQDENGNTTSFTFDKAEVTAASPLWSNASTALPLGDMQRVNADLKALPKNQNEGLRFGGTLMSEDVLLWLIQNAQVKDLITANTINTAIINEEMLNMLSSTYGVPTFGKLYVDKSSNYLDDSQAVQNVLSSNYVYSASGTELQAADGMLPPAPILFQLAPADFTGTGNEEGQAGRNTGVNLAINEIKEKGDGNYHKIEIVAASQLNVIQYRPFARMQVLA
jgi:hypothetical protein